MSIDAVAVVPAAPVLLPAAAPAVPTSVVDGVAALRKDVEEALEGLPPLDAVVLLASGDHPLLHDGSVASLASYGMPDVAGPIEVDHQLLAAVSARGQAPRLRSDRIDGDLAVLALLLGAVRPRLPVVPATVAARIDRAAIDAMAAGITGAAASAGRRVGVIAAGDLAATLALSSPGYVVDGAAAWDEAAVRAVRDGDADAFVALGPGEAERVDARGWAPVGVALQIAARVGLSLDRILYASPAGVGQLVAS